MPPLAVRRSITVACALALAACGTPAYTTVKSGEGAELQKLVDQRYRDYYWPGSRIPKRDQDRAMNALAIAAHPSSGELFMASPPEDLILKLASNGTLSHYAGQDAGPRSHRVRGGWEDAVADAAGNLYVAENQRNTVIKIAADGTTTVVAGGGTGDAAGPATGLALGKTKGLGIDTKGNLYLADRDHDVVWRFTPNADGTYAAEVVIRREATEAVSLYKPEDVAVGADGTVYIADYRADEGTGRLLKLPPTGRVEAIGPVTGTVHRLVVDSAGNLYVQVDQDAPVRKVTPKGEITVLTSSKLPAEKPDEALSEVQPAPSALMIGPDDRLYVGYHNGRLRQIALATPELSGDVPGYPLTTPPWMESNAEPVIGGLAIANGKPMVLETAGTIWELADGKATFVREAPLPLSAGTRQKVDLHAPSGVVFRPDGTLIVADTAHHVLRAIAPDGTATVLAGNGKTGTQDGSGPEASFTAPRSLASDGAGNVYVTDGATVRKVAPDGRVTRLFDLPDTAHDLAVGPDGRFYAVVTWVGEKDDPYPLTRLVSFSATGQEQPVPGADKLQQPHAVAVDSQGRLIVSDDRHAKDDVGTYVVMLKPDGQEQVLVATRKHDRSGQVIGSYTVSYSPGPPLGLSPGDLTAAPNGTVYFVHYTGIFTLRNYGAVKNSWWPF